MTSKDLIAKLGINEQAIVQEAAGQPRMFMDAAEYRVHRWRARASAAMDMDILRSRIALVIRGKKDTKGQKVTEGNIKERIEVHSKVIAKRKVLEEAHAREELAKLIVEAYRQRRDCIRIISDANSAMGMSETKEVERIQARKEMRRKARDLDARRRRVEKEDAEDDDVPF